MDKVKLFAAIVVIVGVAGLAFAQTQFRGDMNLTEPASGSNQYQVGGEDIIKCMQFPVIDSLSADAEVLGVVTLPRKITVKQIDVWANSAFVGPGADSAVNVIFRSTSTSATGYLDSNATYQSTNMTDVPFAAGLACTLHVTDGGGTCTGAIGGLITVWYTDD